MGTFLAMSHLDKYPNRVKGLVLLGAIPAKSPTTETDRDLYSKQQRAAKDFFERKEGI